MIESLFAAVGVAVVVVIAAFLLLCATGLIGFEIEIEVDTEIDRR